MPLHTQGRQRDEGPEESSHDSSEGHAKQEWQSELDDAQSAGIGADRPERRVPYGYLPPNAEQNIEAERDQGIDHDGREEIVAVVAQPERDCGQKEKDNRPAERAEIQAHTFASSRRVNRPCGRSMRTAMMMQNANVSLNAVET